MSNQVASFDQVQDTEKNLLGHPVEATIAKALGKQNKLNKLYCFWAIEMSSHVRHGFFCNTRIWWLLKLFLAMLAKKTERKSMLLQCLHFFFKRDAILPKKNPTAFLYTIFTVIWQPDENSNCWIHFCKLGIRIMTYEVKCMEYLVVYMQNYCAKGYGLPYNSLWHVTKIMWIMRRGYGIDCTVLQNIITSTGS